MVRPVADPSTGLGILAFGCLLTILLLTLSQEEDLSPQTLFCLLPVLPSLVDPAWTVCRRPLHAASCRPPKDVHIQDIQDTQDNQDNQDSPTFSYWNFPGAAATAAARPERRSAVSPYDRPDRLDRLEKAQMHRLVNIIAWRQVFEALVSRQVISRSIPLTYKIGTILSRSRNPTIRYLALLSTDPSRVEDDEHRLDRIMLYRRICSRCSGDACEKYCFFDKQLWMEEERRKHLPYSDSDPAFRRQTRTESNLEIFLDQEEVDTNETGDELVDAPGDFFLHDGHIMPAEQNRQTITYEKQQLTADNTFHPNTYSAFDYSTLQTGPIDRAFPPPPSTSSSSSSPPVDDPMDDRTFKAYDCSRPFNLQAVNARAGMDCRYHRPIVRRKPDQVYYLLQEVPYRRLSARKCKMTTSKLPVFCGSYDHQTIIGPDISLNVPARIEAQECQTLHQNREYYVRTQPGPDEVEDKRFTLRMNITNIVSYESHGRTYYTGNDEIECLGVDWFSPTRKKTISDIVQWQSDRVEISEFEELLIDDEGRLTLSVSQTRLPRRCTADHGECVTTEGTWFWNIPSGMDHCKLYLSRKLVGDEIQVQDGEHLRTIFIDNTRLVRLELGPKTIFKCNREVIPTNYPELFLTTSESDITQRLIHPADADLNLKSATQDDWLANWAKTAIQDYTQKVLEGFCEQEKKEYSHQFSLLAAAQKAVLSGGTTPLGNGKFATSSGEAYYTYICPTLIVQAIDADSCYDSLPVRLQPADHDRLLHFELERQVEEAEQLGLSPEEMTNATDIMFFIEPHSHILTTASIKMPCLSQFAPIYKNIRERWITVNPAIQPTTAPTRIASSNALPEVSYQDRLNFARAGIYSPSTLRQMTRHRMLPRARELAETELAHSRPTSPVNDRVYSTPTAHRMHLPSPPVMKFLETVVDLVHNYGYICAIVIGSYQLWLAVHFLISLCRRWIFPDINQPSRFIMRFLHTVCPNVALLCAGLFPRLRGFDQANAPPGIARRRARHDARRLAKQRAEGREMPPPPSPPSRPGSPFGAQLTADPANLEMVKRRIDHLTIQLQVMEEQEKELTRKLAQVENMTSDESAPGENDYLIIRSAPASPRPGSPLSLSPPTVTFQTPGNIPLPPPPPSLSRPGSPPVAKKPVTQSPPTVPSAPAAPSPAPSAPSAPSPVIVQPVGLPLSPTGTRPRTIAPPPPRRNETAMQTATYIATKNALSIIQRQQEEADPKNEVKEIDSPKK